MSQDPPTLSEQVVAVLENAGEAGLAAGLTKREVFAGFALMGMIAGGTDGGWGGCHDRCVAHADHLIAALEGKT